MDTLQKQEKDTQKRNLSDYNKRFLRNLLTEPFLPENLISNVRFSLIVLPDGTISKRLEFTYSIPGFESKDSHQQDKITPVPGRKEK